jgi:hypothetical protein
MHRIRTTAYFIRLHINLINIYIESELLHISFDHGVDVDLGTSKFLLRSIHGLSVYPLGVDYSLFSSVGRSVKSGDGFATEKKDTCAWGTIYLRSSPSLWHLGQAP